MSELGQTWAALGLTAERQVAALAAAYEVGKMSAGTFAERAAVSVYAANLAATRYADVAVAAWRLAALGLPTTSLGLLPPSDEQERLLRAMATITAHTEALSTTDRATRLAKAEPLTRGRRAYQEGLRARGVPGWKRIVRPNACELCTALAGEVVPMDHDFLDHPGCACEMAPVITETWGDRVKAEQLQLRKIIETERGPVRLSSGLTFRH